MTLQKRLQKIMRRHDIRVAELARRLGEPYTTVREWVLYGRLPADAGALDKRLATLEKAP
jgi:hypothetical protein